MISDSYEVWGVAIAGLLIGLFIIKRLVCRNHTRRVCAADPSESQSFSREHDIHHQALMFLMTQKTDSMLAALGQTIEKERQKLGVVVRKPSVDETLDAINPEAMPVSNDHPSAYDRILPMARNGIAVSTIARQLQLPEAEISLVMRLNAA